MATKQTILPQYHWETRRECSKGKSTTNFLMAFRMIYFTTTSFLQRYHHLYSSIKYVSSFVLCAKAIYKRAIARNSFLSVQHSFYKSHTRINSMLYIQHYFWEKHIASSLFSGFIFKRVRTKECFMDPCYSPCAIIMRLVAHFWERPAGCKKIFCSFFIHLQRPT